MYLYINVFITEGREVNLANEFDRSENATDCLTPTLPTVSVRVKLMTIISMICEFQSTVLNILDFNRCGHIYYTSSPLYHSLWHFWPEVHLFSQQSNLS